MARIAGVDLPGRKHISIALRYLYGIGPAKALEVCKKADVPTDKKTQDLTDTELRRVREVLEGDYKVEIFLGDEKVGSEAFEIKKPA